MMIEDLLNSPLRATDEPSLSKIDCLLHDETLDFDGVEHNSREQTFTIPVRRQFHGGNERIISSTPIWKTYEKEWMHSRVTIRKIRSWDFIEDQGIGCYTFCSWSFHDERLIIKCNEALIISFETDGIDVEIEDVGFRGKAKIRRGLMGLEISDSTIHH